MEAPNTAFLIWNSLCHIMGTFAFLACTKLSTRSYGTKPACRTLTLIFLRPSRCAQAVPGPPGSHSEVAKLYHLCKGYNYNPQQVLSVLHLGSLQKHFARFSYAMKLGSLFHAHINVTVLTRIAPSLCFFNQLFGKGLLLSTTFILSPFQG